MRTALVGCGMLAVLAFGASAVPVLGADNGTVNAQVSVAAPAAACITVPSGTVDFGTLAFKTPGDTSNFSQAGSLTVTSCGTVEQTLLAHGSDASGAAGNWTLTTTAMCPGTPVNDQFNLGLTPDSGATAWLSTTDTSLGPISAGGTSVQFPAIRMPCTGSNGAGETMSMSYVFTATVA